MCTEILIKEYEKLKKELTKNQKIILKKAEDKAKKKKRTSNTNINKRNRGRRRVL